MAEKKAVKKEAPKAEWTNEQVDAHIDETNLNLIVKMQLITLLLNVLLLD